MESRTRPVKIKRRTSRSPQNSHMSTSSSSPKDLDILEVNSQSGEYSEAMEKAKLRVLDAIRIAYESCDYTDKIKILCAMEEHIQKKISRQPGFLESKDIHTIEYLLFHPLAFKALSLSEIEPLLKSLKSIQTLVDELQDCKGILIKERRILKEWSFNEEFYFVENLNQEERGFSTIADAVDQEAAELAEMENFVIKLQEEKLNILRIKLEELISPKRKEQERKEIVLPLMEEEKRSFHNKLIALRNSSPLMARAGYEKLKASYSAIDKYNIKFDAYLRLYIQKRILMARLNGGVGISDPHTHLVKLYNEAINKNDVEKIKNDVEELRIQLEVTILKSAIKPDKKNALKTLYSKHQNSELMKIFHDWIVTDFAIQMYKKNHVKLKAFVYFAEITRDLHASDIVQFPKLLSKTLGLLDHLVAVKAKISLLVNEFNKISDPEEKLKTEFEKIKTAFKGNAKNISKTIITSIKQIYYYLNKLTEMDFNKNYIVDAALKSIDEKKSQIDMNVLALSWMLETAKPSQLKIKLQLDTLVDIEDKFPELTRTIVGGSQQQQDRLNGSIADLYEQQRIFVSNYTKYTSLRKQARILFTKVTSNGELENTLDQIQGIIDEALLCKKNCENARKDYKNHEKKIRIISKAINLRNSSYKNISEYISIRESLYMEKTPDFEATHFTVEDRPWAVVTNAEFQSRRTKIYSLLDTLKDELPNVLTSLDTVDSEEDFTKVNSSVFHCLRNISSLNDEITSLKKFLDENPPEKTEQKLLITLYKNIRVYINKSEDNGHIHCPILFPEETNPDKMAENIKNTYLWATNKLVMLNGNLTGIYQIDDCDTEEKVQYFYARAYLQKLQKVSDPDPAQRRIAYDLAPLHILDLTYTNPNPQPSRHNGDNNEENTHCNGKHKYFNLRPLPKILPAQQPSFLDKIQGYLSGAGSMVGGALLCLVTAGLSESAAEYFFDGWEVIKETYASKTHINHEPLKLALIADGEDHKKEDVKKPLRATRMYSHLPKKQHNSTQSHQFFILPPPGTSGLTRDQVQANLAEPAYRGMHTPV